MIQPNDTEEARKAAFELFLNTLSPTCKDNIVKAAERNSSVTADGFNFAWAAALMHVVHVISEAEKDLIVETILPKETDNCEICHGDKGGVRGNENVIDGKLVCDYCSVSK